MKEYKYYVEGSKKDKKRRDEGQFTTEADLFTPIWQ